MNISKLKKNQILINGTVLDPYNETEKKADVHIENGKIKDAGDLSKLLKKYPDIKGNGII